MNTNWKAVIEAENAKVYVLPQGWDSLEDIAASQDCTQDLARARMQPLVKARIAEAKQFPVWDKATKRLVRVMAYRMIKRAA